MSWFSKWFGGKRESGGSQHPMDLHAFTDRYAAAVREAWPQARVSVSHGAQAADTQIQWVLPDGFKATHFLGNSYQRYLDAPQRLNEVIAAQVDSARAMQRDLDAGAQARADIDQATILPVLKTRDWHEVALEQVRSLGGEEPIAFIVEPLAGDLVLTYVVDTPESMNFLSPDEARQCGLEDRDALHAQAMENLRRRLPDLEVNGGGRYLARLDRNYDASMVLLFGQWRDRIEVNGEPVFAIAARDELMVCGSEDAASLSSLRDIAGQIAQSSAYRLSQALYVIREGRLQLLAD